MVFQLPVLSFLKSNKWKVEQEHDLSACEDSECKLSALLCMLDLFDILLQVDNLDLISINYPVLCMLCYLNNSVLSHVSRMKLFRFHCMLRQYDMLFMRRT